MLLAKSFFTISCKPGYFDFSDFAFHENLVWHSGTEKSTGRIVLITRPGFCFLKRWDHLRCILQGLMTPSSKSILEDHSSSLRGCHKLFICLSLFNMLIASWISDHTSWKLLSSFFSYQWHTKLPYQCPLNNFFWDCERWVKEENVKKVMKCFTRVEL